MCWKSTAEPLPISWTRPSTSFRVSPTCWRRRSSGNSRRRSGKSCSGKLQHRIKNSLQIILALLRIEQRKGDPNGFSRVDEAVQAISLAYDQLQGSREIKQVSLEEYLGKLCSEIMPSLIGSRPVQVESDIEPVGLDFDKAVILGLIVNELVTNSVKHALAKTAASSRLPSMSRKAREFWSSRMTVKGSPPVIRQGWGWVLSCCRPWLASLAVHWNWTRSTGRGHGMFCDSRSLISSQVVMAWSSAIRCSPARRHLEVHGVFRMRAS